MGFAIYIFTPLLITCQDKTIPYLHIFFLQYLSFENISNFVLFINCSCVTIHPWDHLTNSYTSNTTIQLTLTCTTILTFHIKTPMSKSLTLKFIPLSYLNFDRFLKLRVFHTT